MNKRLKELFRQAGFYVDDAGKVWGDPAYHITEQASKLVKLIVEDCVDVVYTKEYSSPVNIAFAIEQHFEDDGLSHPVDGASYLHARDCIATRGGMEEHH